MFDTKNLFLPLLLVLLLGCAAPPVLSTPTVTLAAIPPTSEPTTITPAQANNTATREPTTTSTSLPPPTRAPENTRVPTPTPLKPEIVYAIEPLEVLDVQPAPQAQDVAVSNQKTRIVVRFNFPVAPLSIVNAPNVTPAPLTIEPAIEFEGRWLNSFTYAISPTKNLDAATQYTVTVKATQDAAGRVSKPYTWNFTTLRPRVMQSDPRQRRQSRVRGLKEPISLTFNTEMDRASVETRLRVVRKKDYWTSQGTFEWQGNVVRFTPTYPYAEDTEYLVELAHGAQDVHHRAQVARLELSFWTVKAFALVSSSPKEGDDEAELAAHNGLYLKFTQPLAEKDLQVSIAPTLTNFTASQVGENSTERTFQVRVSGAWKPAAAYTVTIHGDTRSVYGETLGRDTVLHFTTAPLEPYAWIHLPKFGLYDANGPETIYASYGNLERLEYELYRVPRGDVLNLLRFEEYEMHERLRTYKPLAENRTRAWSLNLPKRLDATDVVSTTLNDAFGKRADPGVYLLHANAPQSKEKEARLLFISPYNLALKSANREALVWVTDLSSGKPTANQPITIYSQQGDVLANGNSDREGIFRATLAKEKDGNGGARRLLVLSETAEGSIVAAAASDWNEGIRTWDYNLSDGGYWEPQGARVNLYTDRAVYRTGQTVYFKGIVREIRDPAPVVPSMKSVRVNVYNSHGENILSQELAVNDFGTFNGKVVLNENAPTGDYSIQMENGYLNFKVAQYRRPEFQVEVHADKTNYYNGETIQVNGNASYYFGGPVADAQVTWRLLTQEYAFAPKVKGWWEFFDNTRSDYYNGYDQPSAQQIQQGDTRTDAQGNFKIEIPADLKEFARSQTFSIEAEIVDLNHQSVSNRVRVPVHHAAYYIGLKTQSQVSSVNTEATIDVLTLKASAQANANEEAIPLPKQPLTISIYRGEWVHGRMQVEGKWQWQSSYTETLQSKTKIVTDDNGQAVANFTPTRGGQYRIAAEGKDERGNLVASATWFWVYDNGYVGWKIDNTSRLNLVADKKEYVPGDVAEILVPAPFADAEALFTIERGGILQVERVSIQGNTARYRVPIAENYAPNVFVSAMLVKGRGAGNMIPQFKMGYATLNVKPVAQALHVQVTATCGQPTADGGQQTGSVSSVVGHSSSVVRRPSSGSCQPQDTATFGIEARDYLSKPVRAEFSLALVDKAVKNLVDDNSTPLLETFYQARELGVHTAASLIQSVERENEVVESGGKGGGGGGGGEGSEFTVRRDFLDTAFWNPTVVTDENGRAQVEVKLPDNLTTWHLTVKGITRDTRGGQAEAELISTKPLLLRPVTPRFFVVGDTTMIEAVLNNNTDETVKVSVGLNAEGLTIQDGIARSVEIPARDKASVQWTTKTGVTDKAKLLFTASANELRDAVELTLPVQYPQTTEPLASVEPVESRLVKSLEWGDTAQLPNQLDQLQIELTPSLAAASRESLKFLEAFPYECSEQTTSKFLPNIATYLALERLKLDRQDLFFALQTNVSREIQRLYVLQNPDGGWGWWRNHSSRPVLTAYALFALASAKEAGFAVDQAAMRRAEHFLNDYLNANLPDKEYNVLSERALTLFVLAEMGRDVQGRALNLFEQRAKLDVYGKAFLMMALHKSKQPQAQTLAQELAEDARVTSEYVYWIESKNDYWMMSTDTRTHAIVLMAMARVEPKHPLLPRAVKWLMNARKLGERHIHWETTQETAWAVMALTEWMAAMGELSSNYAYQVTFNGKRLGDGIVDASNLDEARTLRVSIQDTLADLANEIIVTRDSTQGTLYYSAYVRRYTDAEKIPAVTRGIVVERTYYAVDPLTLNATSRVIDSVKVGEYVQVKLTLSTMRGVNYIAVEDMLPAGFEAVDNSLKTNSSVAEGHALRASEDGSHRPYWWYWGHSEIRDDRVALFAEWLKRGTYEYTYLARASVAGSFHALPARAYAMYDPTVLGQSAGALFTVNK